MHVLEVLLKESKLPNMFQYTSIDIFIGIVLALVMMGIGLSLSFDDFINVLKAPKSLLIGLFSQIIILPVIAFLVSYISFLPNPIKVGLIILASCPGGTTSGFITYFFKGNVALSVSFTTINSIITLFTIPFIVNLALVFYYGIDTTIQLPYLQTLVQIFLVTLIPALIGVIIRSRHLVFAEKIKRPLKGILLIALAVVFLIKIFASEQDGGSGISKGELFQILPYAFLLNILCFLCGYFICYVNKLGNRNSYTIAIESAVHNTSLAFLVAGTLLQNQDMIKPSLVYAMFSFWTAVIFSLFVKKFHKVKFFGEFSN
jgi:bile acid:Na+ symporter, BASS family